MDVEVVVHHLRSPVKVLHNVVHDLRSPVKVLHNGRCTSSEKSCEGAAQQGVILKRGRMKMNFLYIYHVLYSLKQNLVL